jgi:hypothetical protein
VQGRELRNVVFAWTTSHLLIFPVVGHFPDFSAGIGNAENLATNIE